MSPHSDLRSRSPRDGLKKDDAPEDIPEEKDVEEKKCKRTRQDEADKQDKPVVPRWTDEEWAEWRREQDQRRQEND
eukprot:2124046-Alexandrium_andersonii.AAC.1